jgi:hypothetical protein
LAAFTVYLDASGSEHDQPCLAVAGYLSTAEQWIEFEKSWLLRLSAEGLDYFHAREILRAVPDKIKRDSLYADLTGIIAGHCTRQIGCCVINSAMDALTEEERKEFDITAYSIAGRACAGQVRQWARAFGARSLPELVFECGDKGKGSLLGLLKTDGFPEPTFRPKRDTLINGFIQPGAVPLQAADLLAFEIFDPIRKIETDGYLRRIRPSFEALCKIPGDLKSVHLKGIAQIHKFATMDPDLIWIPEGADDVPDIFIKEEV